MTTAEAIAIVQAKHPGLNKWGFDVSQGGELASDEKAFETACAFIERQKVTKTVGKRASSSYWWKHVAEQDCGRYIPNGTFIAAAVHMGVPIKSIRQGPNALLGMTPRPEERA